MSTDSFVVQPRRFPGGSIGELAVHGTCNDLAMAGAVPSWISAAFVLEEGFPIAELKEIVADMAAAAANAGVQIVTGDTKVVPKGAADGLFVTTTGAGVIPAGRTAVGAVGARRRQGAVVGVDGRSRHGGHARPRRPGHRGRHPLRHRVGQPAGGTADGGRAVHPLAARRDPGRGRAPSATNWLRPAASGCCSKRSDFPCGPW